MPAFGGYLSSVTPGSWRSVRFDGYRWRLGLRWVEDGEHTMILQSVVSKTEGQGCDRVWTSYCWVQCAVCFSHFGESDRGRKTSRKHF